MEGFNVPGSILVRKDRIQGIQYLADTGIQVTVDLSVAKERFKELSNPGYVEFYNSGVFELDGNRYLVTRCSNYYLCEGRPKEDWWKYRVEKEYLMPMTQQPEWMIEISIPPCDAEPCDFTPDGIYRALGFEDVRSLVFRGYLVMFGTVKMQGGASRVGLVKVNLDKLRHGIHQKARVVPADKMKVLKLDEATASQMTLSLSEKNWVPFVWKDRLYNVYSLAPLKLFETDVDTATCSLVQQNGPDDAFFNSLKLRGSTPLVQIGENEWLTLAHITVYSVPALYTNRWLLFSGNPEDRSLRLVWISGPVKFVNQWIEFTTGMAVTDSTVQVASGVQDCGLVLTTLALRDILALPSTRSVSSATTTKPAGLLGIGSATLAPRDLPALSSTRSASSPATTSLVSSKPAGLLGIGTGALAPRDLPALPGTRSASSPARTSPVSSSKPSGWWGSGSATVLTGKKHVPSDDSHWVLSVLTGTVLGLAARLLL